ncbi:MAG: DUF86 domain-containing protein [Bernardetiaceae bacterium]|nr:DUF86 domain-containing protein [Bernardetiaceae bacterium]
MKQSEYIAHILTEANFLVEVSKDLPYEVFINDNILTRAVVRSLEIIGEASKKLSPELRNTYSEFDWRGFTGLRDKLIHHYFGIDYEIVWDIMQYEIPVAIPFIQTIYDDLKKQE